jgi:hypothetical protein
MNDDPDPSVEVLATLDDSDAAIALGGSDKSGSTATSIAGTSMTTTEEALDGVEAKAAAAVTTTDVPNLDDVIGNGIDKDLDDDGARTGPRPSFSDADAMDVATEDVATASDSKNAGGGGESAAEAGGAGEGEGGKSKKKSGAAIKSAKKDWQKGQTMQSQSVEGWWDEKGAKKKMKTKKAGGGGGIGGNGEGTGGGEVVVGGGVGQKGTMKKIKKVGVLKYTVSFLHSRITLVFIRPSLSFPIISLETITCAQQTRKVGGGRQGDNTQDHAQAPHGRIKKEEGE